MGVLHFTAIYDRIFMYNDTNDLNNTNDTNYTVRGLWRINNPLITSDGVGVLNTQAHSTNSNLRVAIIHELGFINNPNDNAIFDQNFQAIARAIALGVINATLI